jgi:gp16 family phage-associated protein
MRSKTIKNGTPDLNPLQVRIELLRRGESLLSWSRQNGFEQSTVWQCVNRRRKGRKSIEIARRLREELGL